MLVTFNVVVLLLVVVPRTFKFPLTFKFKNVHSVSVVAPLAVTVARVSVSV